MLASSRRAVYIETGGTVLALVSASAPPGPIHLRVPAPCPARRGAGSGWTGSFLSVPGGARRRSTPTSYGATRHSAWSLTETAESGLAGHPAVNVAEWAVGRGDLPAAVGALAGLGPGLTPSGDDVLGGLLVVLAVVGYEGRELRNAVDGAPTHAISRAFLTWAANGQAVEPVHRLLGR